MDGDTQIAGIIMPNADDDEIAALTGDLSDEELMLATPKEGSITVGSG